MATTAVRSAAPKPAGWPRPRAAAVGHFPPGRHSRSVFLVGPGSLATPGSSARRLQLRQWPVPGPLVEFSDEGRILERPPANQAPRRSSPRGRSSVWYRASASGADPANAESPKNTVVVEKIEGQHRSQRVTKWLAEPETAGSTAGRDRVASYLPFGLAGTLPAGAARNRNREAHAHLPFDDAAVATSSAGVQTQLRDPLKDQVAACVYEFGNEREGVASVLRVVLRSKLIRIVESAATR